jgi:L-aminopeptidase/D-esterase-like protein
MSSPGKDPQETAGLEVLEGIYVGHATGRSTGVTVVLCPEGAVVGADVRGGATGTRELDPCRPGHLVERAHGICLAGGSAFGLQAAGGVMRFLEERGAGFPTSAGRVPIVPTAVLYDLALGDARERPDEAMGYAACEAAGRDAPAEGSVGAGTGATVGKLLGRERATKGGLGMAAARSGRLLVAAVAAVNAFGDVVDPRSGRILAGPRVPGGGFADTAAALARGAVPPGFGAPPPDPSTTLVVVATNATLDKAAACRLAAAGSLGVARAVRPVHTRFDGDVVFALATGRVQAPVEQVGALAADQVAEAIVRAVRTATGRHGVPAAGDPVR